MTGPTAGITPGSGPAGATVVVTGTDFTPNATVTITWPGIQNPLAAPTADGSGNLPLGTTVTVPSTASPGAYTVIFTDGATQFQARASFTVLAPSASLSPSSGAAGGTVAVTGANFSPNATVSITWPGIQTPLATPTTDGSGNLPAGLTFTVPSSAGPGTYTVTLQDSVTQSSLGLAFTVAALPAWLPA